MEARFTKYRGKSTDYLSKLTSAGLLAMSLSWTMLTSVSTLGQSTTPTGASPTQSTPADGTVVTRRQADMADQFLDRHPGIAEALSKNPKLIDNNQFVESHPQLREFLKNHPEVREAWREHPSRFMNRERRFDAKEANVDGRVNRNVVAGGDKFLDSHPEISEALSKNPKLIDNKQFLEKHPQLAEYLKNHPEVREAWTKHPYKFEKGVDQVDRRQQRRAERARARR